MNLLPSKLRDHWRRFVNTTGPATAAVVVALVALLLGAAIYLLVTGGPWERKLRGRLASGKELNLDQTMRLGIGWGCAMLAAVSAGLLAVAKWWTPPCAPAFPLKPGRSSWNVYFLLGIVLICGVAGMSRLPRLGHSFWNDEEMAFRKYVWGEYKVADDGAVKFQPVSWQKALFENEKGNNHVLSSVESRLGLALFDPKESAGQTPLFQERAPRMIPLITSFLSIVAVAWLGSLLGGARLGLAAAVLLALSAWHQRYSVEIRGYSTCVLGATLAFGCLIRAFQTGHWRWWIGFAGAQAVFLLSFAGAVYLAAAMNLVALASLWRAEWDRRINALRLCVANGLSLLPLAVLFMPAFLQILDYSKAEAGRYGSFGPANADWWKDFWSHLHSGLPWHGQNSNLSNGTSVEQWAAKAPWLKPLLLGVFPLALGVGIVLMLWKHWATRLVMAASLLAVALAALHNIQTGTPFLPNYLLYIVPTVCIALVYFGRFLPQGLHFLPLLVVLAAYFSNQRGSFLVANAPRQPIREAALWARNNPPDPHQNSPVLGGMTRLTGTFGTSDRQVRSYDPGVEILESLDALKALMEKARQSKTPLRVYHCRLKPGQAESDVAMANFLRSSGEWIPLTTLDGLEEMFSYQVYEFVETAPEKAPPAIRVQLPPADNPSTPQ